MEPAHRVPMPAELGQALASFWSLVPHEPLCRVLTMELDGRAVAFLGLTRRLIRIFASTPEEAAASLDSLGPLLIAEAQRRAAANTTSAGSVIWRWVKTRGGTVTEADVKLLIRVGLWRRFHPDGDAELEAQYCLALVELVEAIAIRHRADRAAMQLLRIISGGFNRVPRLADNRAWAQLQRQHRRTDAERDALVRGDPQLAQYAGRAEWLEDEDRRFAELITGAGLTDREREVAEVRKETLTQAEAGERLDISRVRVQQLSQSARSKLLVAAEEQRPANSRYFF